MCGAGCPHCPPGSQGSCLPGDGMTCSRPGGATLGNPVSSVARALSKRSSTGRMGGGSRGRELCCPGPGLSFASQPHPVAWFPGDCFSSWNSGYAHRHPVGQMPTAGYPPVPHVDSTRPVTPSPRQAWALGT